MTGLGFLAAPGRRIGLVAGLRAAGRDGRLEALARSPCWAIALPLLANSAGWIFTELGRQPWVVQGLLMTQNAVSPTVGRRGRSRSTLIGFTAPLRGARGRRGRLLDDPARRQAGPEPEAPSPPPPTADRPARRVLMRPRLPPTDYMEPADALVRPDRGPLDRLPHPRGLRLRRRHAAAVLGRTEPSAWQLIHTIGPVWDGNEVWLLVAGGATFAAFPDLVRDAFLRLLPAALPRSWSA